VDLAALGAGAGTLADGLLAIYDSSGRLLAADNDSGAASDARLTFTAPSSGGYYVVVHGVGASAGSYTLAVSGAMAMPGSSEAQILPGAFEKGGAEDALTIPLISTDDFVITFDQPLTNPMEFMQAFEGGRGLSPGDVWGGLMHRLGSPISVTEHMLIDSRMDGDSFLNQDGDPFGTRPVSSDHWFG
jgi:hypothetical protein